MKKLLTLAVLASLFFFGCDQGTDITSPISNSPNQQSKLISLPAPSGGITVETLTTRVKEIDGEEGGTFTTSFNYDGGPFGSVRCDSRLVFSAGTFEDDEDISQTFNTESTAMTFGPSMQFNIPVKYSLRYYGLDLTNVDPNTLDFVYIATDGTYQHCEYDTIEMNVENGYLMVRNAQLNHFSRYGFVN